MSHRFLTSLIYIYIDTLSGPWFQVKQSPVERRSGNLRIAILHTGPRAGSPSAHAVVTSYKYTDKKQVQTPPKQVLTQQNKSRHQKYKPGHSKTNPGTPKQVQTHKNKSWHLKYKSRHPKSKSRHPKYNSRHLTYTI